MSRTLYRNASGLPNDEQITTARDLSVLAPRHRRALPALLQVLLDPRVRLRRRDHRQPQSPARPGRRRRRHQDRLHPRFRLQPADLGASRRPLAGRRRARRPHRRGARRLHGRADPRPYRRSVDPRPHGADDRRSRRPRPARRCSSPASPIPAGAIPPPPPTRSAAGADRGRRRGLRGRGDGRAAGRAKPAPRRRQACPRRRRAPGRKARAALAVAAATPAQLGWVKGPDPAVKERARDDAALAAGAARQGDRRSPPKRRLRRPITAAGSSRSAFPTTRPRPTICSPARAPRTAARSLRRAVHRESRQGRGRLLPRPLRRPRFGASRRNRLPFAEEERFRLLRARATRSRHPCRSRTSLASLTCAARAVDPPWSG